MNMWESLLTRLLIKQRNTACSKKDSSGIPSRPNQA